MKEVSIKTKLELKHKLESEWNISDYVPIQSEPIIYDIEVDANGNTLELPEGRTVPYTYERIKIGDGITNVTQLPFLITMPIRGVDYWTEEDIAEIKSYVDNAILTGEW